MPIFHYQCHKCGKKFDLFQRITDEPLKKCSFCGGRAARIELVSPYTSFNAGATIFKSGSQNVAEKKIVKKIAKKFQKGRTKTLRKKAS